jgi:hypothetical protein
LVTGCLDLADQGQTGSLSAAFQSVPLAFDNTQSTFAGPANGEQPWSPEHLSSNRGPGGGGDRGGRGDGGKGAAGPFCMGGGFGDLFMGGGFGFGFGRGKLGDPALTGTCTFDAASGRVICDPVLRGGLTINRSASYADANGNVQQAFDSTTTNTINVTILVSGTITRRDSAVSQVQHASDRTVTGLAPGSTQRKVNGTSAGTENTTGTRDGKHFTSVRSAGDTTKDVIIPVATSATQRPYPISGSVIRAMQVTVTFDGESPISSSRREVVTYDGTDTAKIVITHDGVTKNCTMSLVNKERPVCQ